MKDLHFREITLGCRMERLEKDKIGGRHTVQEMLAVILVRGGRGLEIEISDWIPEIFKGVIVRLDWKWGTNKGEEVENDTHISALGNWLTGRTICWHKEPRKKNRLGGKSR